MLKRKAEIKLESWFNNRKQALLVSGARQIGKTYIIENFIAKRFKNVISINFANQVELLDLFVKVQKADQILINLSSFAGNKMIPNETVIFFDEIQVLYKRRDELKKKGEIDSTYLDLLTAIKSFVIEGKYRFILSGSLLGVSLKDVVLYPLGYLDEYKMYPLDFEEFLWAKGVGEDAINYVKDCFYNYQTVSEGINNMFLNYFKEYVLIGGMPEAVNQYISTSNLYEVNNSQRQVIDRYTYDITTYIEGDEKKLRVREIYKAMPSELNNKNKRFVSSHVMEASYLKKNNIQDEYLWLTNASVAIPVYNVSEVQLPLSLTSERKTLKLFMNDVGLLISSLVSTGVRGKLLTSEKEINYGAPYENVVAEELNAHGFNGGLFYYNSKKHGEVDFVVEYDNDVLPIEIKSGKPDEMNTYNHTALNNLIKIYKIKLAYVFGETNVIKENDVIWQLPIYMISFLKK